MVNPETQKVVTEAFRKVYEQSIDYWVRCHPGAIIEEQERG
jgi:hypothetical protein